MQEFNDFFHNILEFVKFFMKLGKITINLVFSTAFFLFSALIAGFLLFLSLNTEFPLNAVGFGIFIVFVVLCGLLMK
jgi:hypothetical protein